MFIFPHEITFKATAMARGDGRISVDRNSYKTVTVAQMYHLGVILHNADFTQGFSWVDGQLRHKLKPNIVLLSKVHSVANRDECQPEEEYDIVSKEPRRHPGRTDGRCHSSSYFRRSFLFLPILCLS